MATIALNGASINFGMGICAFDSLGTAFSSAKKTTGGLQKAIGSLITKIDLAKTAAKVETAQTEAKNAKTREETKESSLTLAYDKLDTLINDVGTVDNKVSTKVSAEKNDFYKKYEYLKPECEKSKWEQFCDWCGEKIDGFCNAVKNVAKKIADWCKSNIGKIVLGIIAVVGAVLIIVSVIASGGLALVPLLTALGMSAGLATAISMTVGAIAVVSTALALIPNTLDLAAAIDMVIDPENNKIADFNDKLHSSKAYNTFQNTMNITSAVSGGVYSIGTMYNGIKGVSNAELKTFKAENFTRDQIRNAVKQDSAIKNFAKELSKTDNPNKVKGNYGEMYQDKIMREQGYKRISADMVTDYKKPLGQGIDAVYEKGGKYVIGEAKFGTSQLKTLKATINGQRIKQMSDPWIRPRLNSALGGDMKKTFEILNNGYQRQLFNVDQKNVLNYTIKFLDKGAKVIK